MAAPKRKIVSRNRRLSHEALTRSQREALGVVVAESSYLERTIEICIGVLAGIDESTKEVLLNKAMIATKIDLMSELADRRLADENHKKTMTKLVSRLRECNTERVTAVHGIWFPEGEKQGTRGHHARGRIMTLDQLSKLGKKISETHWDLVQFELDVLQHLPTPAR